MKPATSIAILAALAALAITPGCANLSHWLAKKADQITIRLDPADPGQPSTPDPTPADPPGSDQDDTDRTLRFTRGGWKPAAAIERDGMVILSGAAWSKSGIRYGATSYKDWPGANSIACLFVEQADGTWAGGKFDWAPANRRERDWKNIRGGYPGSGKRADSWTEPAAGSRVLFGLFSTDGRLRSNLLEGRWP
jgi:hypothetical protein